MAAVKSIREALALPEGEQVQALIDAGMVARATAFLTDPTFVRFGVAPTTNQAWAKA